MSMSQWWTSNHLILCPPILLLLSVFPSIRVFSNKSALPIRWPKYQSFSFSISPSNEYSALISFRIDWFDSLAVQITLKNLLQHHSSKATVFQGSAFLMVQLLHPHMTTGKTKALTRWTFVGKEISLLFNTVPRFGKTFLPRSKRLLISWLQSPAIPTFSTNPFSLGIKPKLFPWPAMSFRFRCLARLSNLFLGYFACPSSSPLSTFSKGTKPNFQTKLFALPEYSSFSP